MVAVGPSCTLNRSVTHVRPGYSRVSSNECIKNTSEVLFSNLNTIDSTNFAFTDRARARLQIHVQPTMQPARAQRSCSTAIRQWSHRFWKRCSSGCPACAFVFWSEQGPSACQSRWTWGQAWLATSLVSSCRALNVAWVAPSRAGICRLEAELRRPVQR
jgi:hypothetical protein